MGYTEVRVFVWLSVIVFCILKIIFLIFWFSADASESLLYDNALLWACPGYLVLRRAKKDIIVEDVRSEIQSTIQVDFDVPLIQIALVHLIF